MWLEYEYIICLSLEIGRESGKKIIFIHDYSFKLTGLQRFSPRKLVLDHLGLCGLICYG